MQIDKKKISGLEISYLYKKANHKRYVVFLHGWGQNKESFLPVIDQNMNMNILSIDLPGFGDSQEPEFFVEQKKEFVTQQYANVIKDLLNEFEIDEIIIVAHSYGGRISFWLANMDLPIKKMILTGAAGIKPKRTIKYYISVYGYKFQKLLLKTPFYKQFQTDVLSTSGSSDYKNASNIMKQILIRSVNEDLKFLFKTIKQKVILFWGENDLAVPVSDALIMEKEIKNSKLIIVKGSHYAFLENATDFKNLITKQCKG